jgi:hypothetical protein
VLAPEVRRESSLDPRLKWSGDVCCGEGVWLLGTPVPLCRWNDRQGHQSASGYPAVYESRGGAV